MTAGKQYIWTIEHPDHGTAQVTGETRFDAVKAAAHVWQVPWTSVARDCVCYRMGSFNAEVG